MIFCYHTVAKGQMCKEIFPKFFSIALLLSQRCQNMLVTTLLENLASYRVQDTTAVVCGIFRIRIACEIIVVSDPEYGVYTIYG